MTNLYVYDAAYSPNLSKVKAAGGIAVNGYLTGGYSTTTTQPAAARAAGLGYVPTYEEGRDELVGASRATGQAVGRKILAAFKAKDIPIDGSVAVFPSVDVNVSAGRATACNEAWHGMRDVLAGKVSLRAYAEGAVIDALVKAGLVDGKCWLAAPTSWPGFDVNDPNICMVQLVGTDVAGTDKNHLVTDPSALGAWWPEGSEHADMTLTAADVWNYGEISVIVDGKTVKHPTAFYLKRAYADALDALQAANDASRKVAEVAQVVSAPDVGILDRVAALGAAVEKLTESVAALQPAAVDHAIVAEVAQAASDATLAKLAAKLGAQ